MTPQVNFKHEINGNRETTFEVVELPGHSVGEDEPLHAFVHCVHLNLVQVLGARLRGTSLRLDKSDELMIDPESVVGELALYGVFVVKVLELVIAERLAKELSHQQSRVGLVGVSL
jgi:hypothetical protein